MADDNQQPDQRRLSRHSLPELAEAVPVLDRLSGSQLGRLVNIHREGLMVVGSYPFDDERLYQLELPLPESFRGRGTIALGVDCLWCRSENSDMHWTGFKIIDASDEALQDIDVLISCFTSDQ